jgi:hypothetical protein
MNTKGRIICTTAREEEAGRSMPAQSLSGSIHGKRALILAAMLVSPIGVLIGFVGAKWGYPTALGAGGYAIVVGTALVIAVSSEPRKGGLVILYLLIFLNLGTVNPRMFTGYYGEESFYILRALGFAMGIPLIAYSVFLLLKRIQPSPIQGSLSKAYWLFGGFTPFLGIITGIIFENYWVYILGDVYKFFVPLGLFIIVTRCLTPSDTGRMLFLIVLCNLVQAVAELAIHLRNLQTDFDFETFGGHGILALTYFSFQAVLATTKARRRVFTLGYLIVLLEASLSMSRMTWIQVALLHLLLMVLAGWKRGLTYLGKTAMVGIVLLALLSRVVDIAPSYAKASDIARDRLIELFMGHEEYGSESGHLKMVEIQSALLELSEGSPANWLFGFGMGREYYPIEESLEYRAIYEFRGGKIHNIHNTLVAVLFRTGILGLAGFLGMVWVSLRFCLSWFRQAMKTGSETVAYPAITGSFLVLSLINSLSVSVIIGDYYWGILAGIIAINQQPRISPERQHTQGSEVGTDRILTPSISK